MKFLSHFPPSEQSTPRSSAGTMLFGIAFIRLRDDDRCCLAHEENIEGHSIEIKNKESTVVFHILLRLVTRNFFR